MTKYSYTSFSPVTAVDNTAGLIPDHTQTVTYNAWDRVSEISYVSGGDTYKYTITYGPDQERWFSYYKKNGVIQNYTYYGVGYENCYHQEPGTTAYMLRTYYVNTPDGLSCIFRYDSRTGTRAKGDRPQLHPDICMNMDIALTVDLMVQHIYL